MPIYDQIFGCLNKDPESPLSRISQANSCITLDPFSGCTLDCAYCYRHNSRRDTNNRIPKRLFKDEEVIDALVDHPYFVPDKTVVGLHLASSDAFLPQLEKSTFKIMKGIIARGYKNPFWLVVKSGLTHGHLEDFKEIVGKSRGVVLSISYSGMPPRIEPFQEDRFKAVGEAIEAGVSVSLHLRPIVEGWNNNKASISGVIQEGVKNGCENICTGGLRVLDGIKKALEEKDNVNVPKQNDDPLQKELPKEAILYIYETLKENNFSLPVFLHASQAISNLLNIPDYNLYQFRTGREDFLTIPESIQERIHSRTNKKVKTLIREAMSELEISDCEVYKEGSSFLLEKELEYKKERALYHRLGLVKFYDYD